MPAQVTDRRTESMRKSITSQWNEPSWNPLALDTSVVMRLLTGQTRESPIDADAEGSWVRVEALIPSDEPRIEDAARAVHDAFELDKVPA